MLNLRNIFYAFVFCNLYENVRPNVKLSQPETRCVLTDAPNQCGEFCLAAQRPLFDHNQNVQKQLNLLADLLRENKANMDRIENETKASLSNLETTQRETLAILSSLKKGKEVEPNSIQAPMSIPPGFQKIGTRYFFISDTRMTWDKAELFCREKGGYLAAFQNKEEADAIQPKLRKNFYYWLGINDKEKRVNFVSVVSGKPAPFRNGNVDDPFNLRVVENRLAIINGRIEMVPCTFSMFPICQLDIKV